MFAAYLKLLMPLVIVLPGICAAVLFPVLEKSDQAYPTMMTLLPNGLLGLTFAFSRSNCIFIGIHDK